MDQSRAPKHCPHRTAERITTLLVESRQAQARSGARANCFACCAAAIRRSARGRRRARWPICSRGDDRGAGACRRGMATLSTMFEPASLKRVKNLSFGGCVRRPTGIFPGPRPAVRSGPPHRKGSSVHSGPAGRRAPPLCHSQVIAHQGACGKAGGRSHHRRPNSEPSDMGGTICVCCCRRMDRA